MTSARWVTCVGGDAIASSQVVLSLDIDAGEGSVLRHKISMHVSIAEELAQRLGKAIAEAGKRRAS